MNGCYRKCFTKYKQALPKAIGMHYAEFSLSYFIESDVFELLRTKSDNAKGRRFAPLPSF